MVPIALDWGDSSVVNNALYVDLRAMGPALFSAVRALWVDNSQSGADVQFIFPDTQTSLDVPAGKGGLYPVISNSKDFYAVASNPLSTDRTFVAVLNCIPPVVDVSRPTFSQSAIGAALPLTAPSSTALINASCTLIGASIALEGAQAGAGLGVVGISLQTVTGASNLLTCGVRLENGQIVGPSLLYNQNELNLRANGGVNVVVTTAGVAFADGKIDVNLIFRTP